MNNSPAKTVDKSGRAARDKTFDLEERTAKFAEAIIIFCSHIPRSPIFDPLVHQLMRSGTSVGANYSEANNASSRNDFAYKIGLCRKEARETMYWLRLIGKAHPPALPKAREIWRGARNLISSFPPFFENLRPPKTGWPTGSFNNTYPYLIRNS